MSEVAHLRSLDRLLDRLESRGERLPYEIGAFVLLELCENLKTRPVPISASDVYVDDDGSVRLRGADRMISSEATSLETVLPLMNRMVHLAGTDIPPRIRDRMELPPEENSIMALRDEIEASLVPLNRAASRRVLARAFREVAREDATVPGAIPAVSSPGEISSAGTTAPGLAVEMTSPGAFPAVENHENANADEHADAHADADSGWNTDANANNSSADGYAEPALAVSVRPKPIFSTDLPPEGPPAKNESRVGVYVFAVLLLAGLAVGAWFAADRSGSSPSPPRSRQAQTPRTAPAPESRPAPSRPSGELRIHANPPGAQVLLYIGRSPLRIDGLPKGVAHEFVLVDEARHARRAVVEARAQWPTEGLLVAFPETSSQPDEFGTSLLAGAELGAPTGEHGAVRIENLAGARIYQLVGFAPEVVVRGIAENSATELLVVSAGYETARIVIGPSDWRNDSTGPVAESRVELQPLH